MGAESLREEGDPHASLLKQLFSLPPYGVSMEAPAVHYKGVLIVPILQIRKMRPAER